MVQVIQPRDIGGEMGQAIGGGLGGGFGEAMKMLNQKRMIGQGLERVKEDIRLKRENKEKINPLDVSLGMFQTFSHLPGGMQAISESMPAINKEIMRLNMEGDGDNVIDNIKKMPPNSVIEDPIAQGAGLLSRGVGKVAGFAGAIDESSEKQPQESSFGQDQQQTMFDPDKFYDERLKHYNDQYQDPEIAERMATASLNAKVQEQARRDQEQKITTEFLKEKISDNFDRDLSAPFKNEMEKEFYDLRKTTDKNRAWNQIYPKYRNAQKAEESLKFANASTRPGIFLGDMDNRMNNARTALKPISDIDPEYALGLATDELDFGVTEAAKIIRPGSNNLNNLVKKIPRHPLETDFEGTEKYLSNIDKNLKSLFKSGWNSQTDSLLSLRGELFDKGYPPERFLEQVVESFPGTNKDPRLSTFNRNEYDKLGEPVVPGLQELFKTAFSSKFMPTLYKRIDYGLKGKR